MKTTPFHFAQAECLRQMDGREYFALFCEQGTGKTWLFLADAEREYGRGTIEALLVVAPKGVDSNWVLTEIPMHLDVPHIARFYRSGASQKHKRSLEDLFRLRAQGEVPPLRILTINIQALLTKDGAQFARRFLSTFKAMMVVDESRRIKNPKSGRTKSVMQLKPLAAFRRIGTGTPVALAPMDIFSQMEFLHSGLLGTTSYRAFVAEYAELLDEDNHLMKHIRQRIGNSFAKPQIVLRDENNNPIWKNLDKLQKLIAPHSFRILKKDCLDLPPKIYQKRYFELSSAAQRVYNEIRDELRIVLGREDFEEHPEAIVVKHIASLVKLRQVTSGFVIPEKGAAPIYLEQGKSERLKLFEEVVEDLPEGAQFLVFAQFKEELAALHESLTAAGISHAEYSGATRADARDKARAAFQVGQLRALILQTDTGGIGITLTAAEFVIFYSHNYDAEQRWQAEDRAHRIGTKKAVIYIDLLALNTRDEAIMENALRKKALSAATLGDFQSDENQG